MQKLSFHLVAIKNIAGGITDNAQLLLSTTMTIEDYFKSLPKEVLVSIKYQTLVKFYKYIDPMMLDHQLIKILLQYESYTKPYSGCQLEIIQKFIRSLSHFQICELISACISHKSNIIKYIPYDMLTESLCKTIRDTSISYYKEIIMKDLANKMSEYLEINNYAYSEEFLIEMMTSHYNMETFKLPKKMVTYDFFWHLCEKKNGMKIVFKNPTLRTLLTLDFCTYCYINEIVHVDYIPKEFVSNVLRKSSKFFPKDS